MGATTTLARLNVLLEAKTDRFDKKMKGVRGRLGGLSSKFASVKAAALPIAGALAAVGGAAAAAALKAGRFADALLDLEQQTGVTTDQLQRFRNIEATAGIAQDSIARAAEGLTRRLRAAGDESKTFTDNMALLGVSAFDSEGNLRSMSDLLPDLLRGLNGMDDVTTRNAIGMQVFGRRFTQIAPAIGLASDELEAWLESNENVIPKDQLQRMNEGRIAWDEMKRSVETATISLSGALTPALEFVAGVVERFVIPFINQLGDDLRVISDGFKVAGDLVRFVWLRTWLRVKEIAFAGVAAVLGALARLTSFVPGLGDKIAGVRDRFAEWADGSLTRTRDRLVEVAMQVRENLARAHDENLTPAIDRSTAAVQRNTAALDENMQRTGTTVAQATASWDRLVGTMTSSVSDFVRNTPRGTGKATDKMTTDFERWGSAVQSILSRLQGKFGGFLGKIAGIGIGFATGGPLGGALAFAGSFATGGTIPSGSFGLVGERGPELVGGPATVTPGGMLRLDSSSLPPPPQRLTPDALAVDAWWRDAFSHLVLDGRDRGVLP